MLKFQWILLHHVMKRSISPLYSTELFCSRLHKHGHNPRLDCLVEAYKCVAVILVSVLFEVQNQQAAIRTSPIYFGLVVYLILSTVGEQCVFYCFSEQMHIFSNEGDREQSQSLE